jgi:hypothetical protein
MKLKKSLFILCATTTLLNSCGTFSEVGSVMRNQKTISTDEFLIKKKEPLTQPPDFKQILEPGSIEKKVSNRNSIEEILRTNKTESNNSKSKSTSTEESILNQIKK